MAAADVALIKLDGNGNPILDANGHPIIDTDGFVGHILTTNTTKNVSIFRARPARCFRPLRVDQLPVRAQQSDPSWNQAGFTVGDFDNDGYLDVFAPAQARHPGPLDAWGCFTNVCPKTTGRRTHATRGVLRPVRTSGDPAYPDQIQLTFNGPRTPVWWRRNTGQVARY
jgi:hypothetical protein